MPIDKILKRAKAVGKVSVIYLFGSYAQSRVTPGSDIDFAILFDKKPDPLEILDLKEDLAGITGCEADVAVLNTASPILGMQVLKHGFPLVVPDSLEAAKYEMVTISKYFDLKRIRRPIEEALIAEAADG